MGRPHGRDQIHWDEAKEIVALEDSLEDTLLPRDTGASEPEEPAIAVTNQGDMPNLTDQGASDLTATDREPAVTQPPPGTGTGTAPDRPAKDSASAPAAGSPAASPVGNGAPVSVTERSAPAGGGDAAAVTRSKAGA